MSASVCVKNNKTVKRVSRIEADKMVASGNWQFCPKSEWKALRKPDAPVEEAKEEKKPKKRRGNPKGKNRKEK